MEKPIHDRRQSKNKRSNSLVEKALLKSVTPPGVEHA
jgi:hypothetical protein